MIKGKLFSICLLIAPSYSCTTFIQHLTLSHRVRSTGRRDLSLSSPSPPRTAIRKAERMTLVCFPKLKLADQSCVFFSFSTRGLRCLDNTLHNNVVCIDFLNVVISITSQFVNNVDNYKAVNICSLVIN